MAEADIFGRQKYTDLIKKDDDKDEGLQSQKYEFLKKKIKPNEEAYEECFPEG